MFAPNSFQRNISVDSLMRFEQHKESYSRLKYIVQSKGFGLLTGLPGTGKSSIIRMLETSLDKSEYLFCYINDSELKPKSLYASILYAMNIEPYSFLNKLKRQFAEAASTLYYSENKSLVLVIDNAQDLPEKSIREVRYLLNFEIDSFSPLSIILIGQPELWDTLRLRSFEPVFQCILNHYRLFPLDIKQTREYIIHHLKLSNLDMLFPDDVVEKIYAFSKGIPRVINNICRHCLIDMTSNELDLVDFNVLSRVLNEFSLGR